MVDISRLPSSSAGLFVKGKTKMAEQIEQPEDASVGFFGRWARGNVEKQ